MGIGWMILIFFGGTILFFFLLGRLTWGSGADLLDWDPTERNEQKARLELEDVDQMLELTNRRRRANGLPELTRDDLERRAYRDR